MLIRKQITLESIFGNPRFGLQALMLDSAYTTPTVDRYLYKFSCLSGATFLYRHNRVGDLAGYPDATYHPALQHSLRLLDCHTYNEESVAMRQLREAAEQHQPPLLRLL